MAEPVRTSDLTSAEPSLGRADLKLACADRLLTTPGERNAPIDEAATGRAAILGAAIGFLTAAVGVTVAGTLAGIGFGASLGLGAFIGVFGGGGFGFMMGATIPMTLTATGAAPHDRITAHTERE